MNNSTRESLRDKNPYKRGADDGFIMGVVLIAMFLALTCAARSPLAAWVGLLIMVVGVPLTTFSLLRRSFLRDNGLTLFSSLWMQGIVMFFCATLLLALFEYVYLRILNPGFTLTLFNQAADYYSASGTEQGVQMAKMLRAMIRQNLVPNAINVAIETIWVGVFTGSLLSALMASLVRLKKVEPLSKT